MFAYINKKSYFCPQMQSINILLWTKQLNKSVKD